MGGTSYNFASRSTRATKMNYATASMDALFSQNSERKAHESMKSQGITLRESRDSDVNPITTPIIIALDVTGSMGHIPHELIKEGLPKLVSGLIERGIPAPAILFLAVGDHEADREPLQIGQFESGDEELDLWLTRTYIEGNGGGNGGESYSLAHYFAARHCQTDHWDKRGKKGILITIGDEANLKSYPSAAMKEITGSGDVASFTDSQIMAEAQERWELLHFLPGRPKYGAENYWKEALGERTKLVPDFRDLPKLIIEAIHNIVGDTEYSPVETSKTEVLPKESKSNEQEIL